MSNIDRFPIRPRPADEESLSSFLSRVCMRNKVSLYQMLRYLATDNSHIMNQSGFRMDILPSKYIDLKRLSFLCGLEEEQINKMSLYPLQMKMYDEKESDRSTINLMSLVLKKDKRYYCPLCIKKSAVYKLIWQIEGIEICDEHRCDLVSYCPTCKKNINYIGMFLQKRVCPHCENSLLNQKVVKIEDSNIIFEQLQRYDQWRYILNNQRHLVKRIRNYTNEKSLILALFCLRRQNPNVNLRHLPLSTYLHFVKDEPKGKRLSIKNLFEIINKLGIDIKSLAELDIPSNTVARVLKGQKFERKPGPCLSPWCSSFGTSASMEYLGKRINWQCFSLCTGCFMKYGYKNGKGKKWKEAYGIINYIMDNVLPLLQGGKTVTEIARDNKVGIKKIRKYEAYINYHHIFGSYNREKVPTIPNNIVELFRELTKVGTKEIKMFQKAKVLYGWDYCTFQYFLASREVQMYMAFQCPRGVRQKTGVSAIWEKRIYRELYLMMKDKEKITLKSVAARLKCTTTTLRNHNLLNAISEAAVTQSQVLLKEDFETLKSIASDYLMECEYNLKEATKHKVYEKLSHYSRIKYPQLEGWLNEQIKLHKERVRKLVIENYKENCVAIFRDLRMENGRVSIERVAERLGLNYMLIRRKYPALLDIIREEILRLSPLN